MRKARAESGERRFERVVRERVDVFARMHALAEADDGDAMNGGAQHPEDHVGRRACGEIAARCTP